MKIAMIGTGYVGLVSGTCFSEMGNDVICVDIDAKKIENLRNGVIPIYEPGLEDLVLKNSANGNLIFSTDLKGALEKARIIFVAVGTPMGEDGSADLRYVLAVASEIGKNMTHHLIIVDKSTVPVGTGEKVRATIQTELDTRKSDLTFDVVSNPEFLKEGDAVEDFMKPNRIVVGADNEEVLKEMRELYAPFMHSQERFYAMDIRSAELTKYAGNAMLATRISFMNELALLCEKVRADINNVRIGIGSDNRIGSAFLYPSCGYGGSCFPKDIRALEKLALTNDLELKIIHSVQEVNNRQKRVIVEKVINKFGKDLKGRIFAVWGLAFKAETDDMREASSIVIISELTKLGAKILAYDPKAMNEAKNCYLKDNINIDYVESKYSALNGADALILLTEWKEFRSPDFEEMKKRLKNPIIFDGRNIYDKDYLRNNGFEYFGIGIV